MPALPFFYQRKIVANISKNIYIYFDTFARGLSQAAIVNFGTKGVMLKNCCS